MKNTLGLHVNQRDMTYQTMHHIDFPAGWDTALAGMGKLLVANALADWLETTNLISADDRASIYLTPRADGLRKTQLASISFHSLEPTIYDRGTGMLKTMLVERLDPVSLEVASSEVLELAMIVLAHRAVIRALAARGAA